MSCRNEFLTYKEKYISELTKELNSCSINLNGKIKSFDRMTYRNGLEIPSMNIRVIFLIKNGKFFKETVSYDIYIDEKMDMAILTKNYTWTKKTFAKNDINKIARYIINNTENNIVNYEKKLNIK